MTSLMRGRRRNLSYIPRSSSSNDSTMITDLTGIGITTSSSTNNKDFPYSPYLCEFCDVPLIKKMDDPGNNKRYICPRCTNIQDPLNVDEFNKIKHAERGQTIRSSSSSAAAGGSEEGRPFAEMFNSNNTITTENDKGSLRNNNKGTQVSRSLFQSINDPDGPNEEANLRSQNMRILKTETTYPESGRKIVKTYDDED
jgi:hypothetical protein